VSDALRALGAQTAELLRVAGAPDEQLAELDPPRRLGPFTRRARFRGTGRAWRLGAVLVSDDGELFSTGTVTRAVEPRPFASDKTLAGQERRELQALAARAFRAGDTVNHGHHPLRSGDGGDIVERDGMLLLRLPDALVPLADYLDDRVRLAAERSER
jgi:hypothetical protein